MNRPGIQAWVGLFLFCGAISWRVPWVGVALFGFVLFLDAAHERWRIRH